MTITELQDRSPLNPGGASMLTPRLTHGAGLWGLARKSVGVLKLSTDVNWVAALKPCLASQRATEHARLMTEVASSGLVVVERGRDARAVEYWQQGDESLNTVDVMKQRIALRHDARILAALLAWWETALRSEGINDPQGRATLGAAGHKRCLTLLFTGLIDGWNADSAEGRNDLEQAWQDDSKGKGGLARDDFYDALFELADVWTETVEALEYAPTLTTPLELAPYPTDVWSLRRPKPSSTPT